MTGRDSALSALRDHVEDLAVALAVWESRDDARPQPEARRAANDAMAAVDGAIRELYGLRAGLTGEIRAADDAAMARSAELLRQIQKDGGPPARA
jgi:hypothetical protein